MPDNHLGNCLLEFHLPQAKELTDGMKVQEIPLKEDCINKIMSPVVAQVTKSVEKARDINAVAEDIINRASVYVKPNDFPKFFEVTLAYGGDNLNGSLIILEWSRWAVE